MAVVRRKKENIDMLEHAMMGVRTLDKHHQIVSFAKTSGLIGSSSRVEVDVRGSNPEEREVIVTMPKIRKERTGRT
jgi:hypothetical protein